MRKQWFGDSRDYVKWSCIRAEAADGFAVVYGPMLRPDSYSGEKLDDTVVHFFNKHKSFQIIADLFPSGFSYLPNTYELRRATEYFNHFEEHITTIQREHRVLVFLDPDTGIEPEGKASDEHLRRTDIQRVCGLLRAGEKLVVYQHSSRTKGWQNVKYNSLIKLAQEVHANLSEPFFEIGTAKDVCFFTFTKIA